MARNATNKPETENLDVVKESTTETKASNADVNEVPETVVVQPKKKEISLTDRVPITNLNDWDLHFVSTETDKDIVIPAKANKIRKLTVAEIDGQVQSGNIMFVGTDGMGNNACIKIEDEDVFRYVFRLDDNEPINVRVLDLDSVKKLIAISDREEYERELKALVVTNSDKRMISKLAIKANIENVEGYKKTAIENLIGYKF